MDTGDVGSPGTGVRALLVLLVLLAFLSINRLGFVQPAGSDRFRQVGRRKARPYRGICVGVSNTWRDQRSLRIHVLDGEHCHFRRHVRDTLRDLQLVCVVAVRDVSPAKLGGVG